MGPTTTSPASPSDFIRRWERSEAAERANYTMFLTELCTLLAVPGPEPTRSDDRDNAYVFERSVPMDDGDGKTTVGRIDLYKRGCFVLEAKQGSISDEEPALFVPETPARVRRGTAVRGTAHWDAAMKKAKGQAERYVRSLPADEGNPPFIIVVDVGYVIFSEKLRKIEELTDKDRVIHEQGLVSVLKQIHDDLDAAVADAYGWPPDLADEEILRRLVALNAERAEEEKRGLIRWLRPEFQNPGGASANQGHLGLTPAEQPAQPKKADKLPWPKSLAEQAQAVRAALGAEAGPASAAELSKRFKGAKADRVGELLATLTALGKARSVGEERFVA